MKCSFVSVLGSAGLVAGLMAGAPVVMAEESSTVLRTPSPVTIAAASTSNGAWFSVGDGVDGSAWTMVTVDDTLFVGGDFTTGSGSTLNRIAAFSLSTGAVAPLGQGVDGYGGNTSVLGMALRDDSLFVGGAFNSTFSQSTSNSIAAWNSPDDTFNALGSGVTAWSGNNPIVNSVTSANSSSEVYIGGTFTAVGGTSAGNISVWNGSTWQNLATGTDAEVRTIAVTTNDDSVLVGGDFTSAGGIQTGPLALWSVAGQAFQTVGPLPAGVTEIHSTSNPTSDDTVFLGGNNSFVGSWSPTAGVTTLPSSPGSFNVAVAFDAENQLLYVGTSGQGVYVLDLRTGKYVSLREAGQEGLNNSVLSIALDDSVPFFGGFFTQSQSGVSLKGLAKWTWSPPYGAQVLNQFGSGPGILTSGVSSSLLINGQGFVATDDSVALVPTSAGLTETFFAPVDYVVSTDTLLKVNTGSNIPVGNYDIFAQAIGGRSKVGEVTVHPPTPANLSLTSDDTSITVTTTDSGYSYLAEAALSYPSIDDSCLISPGPGTCVVDGLKSGTQYWIYLYAVDDTTGISSVEPNAQSKRTTSPSPSPGPAPPDPTPTPTPPLPSKPSAPGSVTLDPGRGQIEVSWTPATAPSDAPVIIYRAVASPGGASCQAAATATSCDITGLTNGTAYTVFVTAINGGGQGPAVQAGPVTPSGEAPARPGRPQVTAGNSQVNVTVVPGSGGGDAGSYTATASPGGASCTVASPGVTCAITGLTNGTAYTVTTTATNGAGTSPASPASASVTPNGDLPEAPATPARPTAVAGDSSATVTVTAGSGGGQPDTFTVTANPGGASCTITAPDTSCEVTGLTNGTAYSFTAVATNAGGSSDPSAASAQVTPQVEAPAPPKSVQVLVGDGQATITATPSDEGGPVEKFVVISTPGTKACVITLPETSCVIDGLTNGVAYTFAVRAVNAGGSTPAASPTAPVTPEPAINPTPVPLVNPPAAGESQAVEDGNPVTDLQVAPDRTGTGLSVTSSNFTLDVEGVDRRGNPVGLQNDQVLLLVDDGRARTQGTGFRPGSTVKLFLEVPVIGDGSMLRIGAAAALDLGELRVDNLGEFLGTVNLPADLAPGDYVLQVAGVTQGNGERAVSLGVRVVDNNASITLVKGKRVKAKGRTDRIRATGTSEGIPAGTKLVPYFRLGKKGEFKQGVATIVVQEDGSFTWTRKVTRSRLLQAYVAFASAESNTVTWRRIR